MCSSRGICNSNERSRNRSTHSESTGSGAHYALCALGVGLIALGVVMIVWTVIPVDGEESGGSTNSSSNSTADSNDDNEEGEISKSSSVAMVLVGVGLAMLLLSIFLGVRSKRRARENSEQSAAAATAFLDHVAVDQAESAPDPASFSVPTYEEVVGSSDYPVRQSNLRQSTTHLPSYEDIIAAVENEGTEPANQPAEDTHLNESMSPEAQAATAANAEPQADASARQPSLPARSASRASRLLRPLRVRRIKSDKLHLKDFRIQIRSPTQNPVTIEPITPPPQYENKAPELG
ncbi:transmembrane protein 51b [Dunckerocampus dactyliophorus]|uniref:transmembrane protein 51b n=1 Tax=Dunckerocampus dactyliophorus TaxID=161453 RepID=UPI002404D49B|nr:transmembrane protein 51b [Dunckerocampus dactyliophorus]